MRCFAVTLLLLSACATTPRPLHVAPPGLEKYSQGIDWKAAGDETAQLLSAYLQVDTVNPPGNETLGAELLKAHLAKDGVESSIHEFAPGRGSLLARLPATKPSGEKPLCLLSHLDVVPAEAETWPKDKQPLSGALVDGVVWGRGALDTKGLGAVEVETFLLLKRRQVPLTRDVLLLAVADEEVGEGGMRLLTDTMWSEVDCGHLVNEGGMGVKDALAPGQTAFAISVVEKGALWVTMRASGEAGHGSTPREERAPARLVRALERIVKREPKPKLHPALYELLRRSGEQRGGFTGFVLQRPSLVDSFAVGKLLEKPTTRAMVTDTCQVTGFEGKGSAPNVVPSQVSAVLDCRVLPGTTVAALVKELEEVVADVPGISFELSHGFVAEASDWDDPFFDALARHAVAGRDDAIAGPTVSPGYTDSILARKKGTRAYGFAPFEVTLEELNTIHGKDERVSVENLRRGVEVLFKAVVDVAAAP
ncbi:MAG: M20/M25/M40 family metallo-hydrolase [Myxococcales bacterium]|nr:M20/M25/M40 family metallo-hydrolase [Myxococcales bacterium]